MQPVVIFTKHFSPALNDFELIQKSGIDQLFQEEFDISQFRVLDSQRFQHANVTIFNCQEN